MLRFLAFGSRSVERSEDGIYWRSSSVTLFPLIHFDLIKVILEVALRRDYGECNSFFVLPTLSHFLKNVSEERFPTSKLASQSKEPFHRRTNILVFFLVSNVLQRTCKMH